MVKAKKQRKPLKTKIKKPIELAKKSVKTVHQVVEKKVNIPNLLTRLRIWAIPLIVGTFFLENPAWAWVGVVLFCLAGITDYMDGYLARHLNQLSRFGRVLDPIADKLLIGAMLLAMAYTHRFGAPGTVIGTLNILSAIIILCREILVSGLREFLAEIRVGCPVTKLAKWKTTFQMLGMPMLMVSEPRFSGCMAEFWKGFGSILFWLAAALTIKTGYDYWNSGRKYMDD